MNKINYELQVNGNVSL